ncbi:MAG TPA: HAD family hydrolase [Bryobacteraceae bacterium]|nr:HAD family hydrolase [Bryobacteraceae bacterium]
MALILFDIDGTLLRRAGEHHREALIAGIRQVTGLRATFDGVDTSGRLDRDLIRLILKAAGASERQINSNMSRIVTECQSAYLGNCASGLADRVCPGVPQFLEGLRNAGAVMGLVTGNLSQIGWKKMELAGLRHFFSVGAFAQDGRSRARVAQVARRRAVKERLVSRSSPVALIGDHPNDIEAAKINAFVSVAVATGLVPLEQLETHQPDIVVRDLSQLEPHRLLTVAS